MSRQIVTHANDDPEGFLAEFTDRARRSPFFSSALYATGLPHKARAGAVRGIFESISHSGHFSMYADPVEMWRRIGGFHSAL